MNTVFLEIIPITHNEDTYFWIYNLTNQYLREVKNRGGEVKIVSEIWNTNEGGYEHVILKITEENAYNYFKEREGKQRLTKVPMFATKSSPKVMGYQTLIISIDVYPEAPNNFELVDIYYRAVDLQADRNMKVAHEDYSAELTHKPTGVIVTCGKERSQIKNKEMAEKILKAKIYEKSSSSKISI